MTESVPPPGGTDRFEPAGIEPADIEPAGSDPDRPGNDRADPHRSDAESLSDAESILVVPAPRVAPPVTGCVRVRMDLAYVGTSFRGFAENRNVRTVAGELRACLARVLGTAPELAVAGRTDAGVHARSQVVSFDAAAERFDPVALRNSLNSMLMPEISVKAVTEAEPDFHARFSAVGRTYRYQILNSEVPDPFLAGRVWFLRNRLPLERLREAASLYLGTHDFTGFCRQPKDKPDATMVRRVKSVNWSEEAHPEGRLLTFEVSASAFCHQMVRSLVGAMVEVGFGRADLDDIRSALKATERALDGRLGPPEGLILWDVAY